MIKLCFLTQSKEMFQRPFPQNVFEKFNVQNVVVHVYIEHQWKSGTVK